MEEDGGRERGGEGGGGRRGGGDGCPYVTGTVQAELTQTYGTLPRPVLDPSKMALTEIKEMPKKRSRKPSPDTQPSIALRDLVTRILRDQTAPMTCLVRCDPGIGRSTLAAELARSWSAQDGVIKGLDHFAAVISLSGRVIKLNDRLRLMPLLLPGSCQVHGESALQVWTSMSPLLWVIDDLEDLPLTRLRDILTLGGEGSAAVLLATPRAYGEVLAPLQEEKKRPLILEMQGIPREQVLPLAEKYLAEKIQARSSAPTPKRPKIFTRRKAQVSSSTQDPDQTETNPGLTKGILSFLGIMSPGPEAQKPEAKTKNITKPRQKEAETEKETPRPEPTSKELKKGLKDYLTTNLCRIHDVLRWPGALVRICDMYLDDYDQFSGLTTASDLLWALTHWEVELVLAETLPKTQGVASSSDLNDFANVSTSKPQSESKPASDCLNGLAKSKNIPERLNNQPEGLENPSGKLKNLPEKLSGLPKLKKETEELKSRSDKLKRPTEMLKNPHDELKSSKDKIKNSPDNLRKTTDKLKSPPDKLKSSPDDSKSPREKGSLDTSSACPGKLSEKASNSSDLSGNSQGQDYHEKMYNWLLKVGEIALQVDFTEHRLEGEAFQEMKSHTAQIFGEEAGEVMLQRVFKVRTFFNGALGLENFTPPVISEPEKIDTETLPPENSVHVKAVPKTISDPGICITGISTDQNQCEVCNPEISLTPESLGEAEICIHKISLSENSGQSEVCIPKVSISERLGQSKVCIPEISLSDKMGQSENSETLDCGHNSVAEISECLDFWSEILHPEGSPNQSNLENLETQNLNQDHLESGKATESIQPETLVPKNLASIVTPGNVTEELASENLSAKKMNGNVNGNFWENSLDHENSPLENLTQDLTGSTNSDKTKTEKNIQSSGEVLAEKFNSENTVMNNIKSEELTETLATAEPIENSTGNFWDEILGPGNITSQNVIEKSTENLAENSSELVTGTTINSLTENLPECAPAAEPLENADVDFWGNIIGAGDLSSGKIIQGKIRDETVENLTNKMASTSPKTDILTYEKSTEKLAVAGPTESPVSTETLSTEKIISENSTAKPVDMLTDETVSESIKTENATSKELPNNLAAAETTENSSVNFWDDIIDLKDSSSKETMSENGNGGATGADTADLDSEIKETEKSVAEKMTENVEKTAENSSGNFWDNILGPENSSPEEILGNPCGKGSENCTEKLDPENIRTEKSLPEKMQEEKTAEERSGNTCENFWDDILTPENELSKNLSVKSIENSTDVTVEKIDSKELSHGVSDISPLENSPENLTSHISSAKQPDSFTDSPEIPGGSSNVSVSLPNENGNKNSISEIPSKEECANSLNALNENFLREDSTLENLTTEVLPVEGSLIGGNGLKDNSSNENNENLFAESVQSENSSERGKEHLINESSVIENLTKASWTENSASVNVIKSENQIENEQECSQNKENVLEKTDTEISLNNTQKNVPETESSLAKTEEVEYLQKNTLKTESSSKNMQKSKQKTVTHLEELHQSEDFLENLQQAEKNEEKLLEPPVERACASGVLSSCSPMQQTFLASWAMLHRLQQARGKLQQAGKAGYSERQVALFTAGLLNRARSRTEGYGAELDRRRVIAAVVDYTPGSHDDLPYLMDLVVEIKAYPDLLSYVVEASEYPDEWFLQPYHVQEVALAGLLLHVSPSRVVLVVGRPRLYSEVWRVMALVAELAELVWLDGTELQFRYGAVEHMDKFVQALSGAEVKARVDLLAGCVSPSVIPVLHTFPAFRALVQVKLRAESRAALSDLLVLDRALPSLLWLEIKVDFDLLGHEGDTWPDLPCCDVPLFDLYLRGCGDTRAMQLADVLAQMHVRYSGVHLDSSTLTPEGVFALLRQLKHRGVQLHATLEARQCFRAWYFPQLGGKRTLSDREAAARLGFDDRAYYSNHRVLSSCYTAAIDAWNLTTYLEDARDVLHFTYRTKNLAFSKRLNGKVDVAAAEGEMDVMPLVSG